MTTKTRVGDADKAITRSSKAPAPLRNAPDMDTHSTRTECKGCQIVSGERPTPGGVIVENDYWHATHIGEPAALVRGMVVMRAKRHVVHLAELTESELIAAAALLSLISKGINSALAPERIYCMFFGENTPHAHFSLIPRYAHMPVGDPVSALSEIMVARRYTIPAEEAGEIALRLKAEIKKHIK